LVTAFFARYLKSGFVSHVRRAEDTETFTPLEKVYLPQPHLRRPSPSSCRAARAFPAPDHRPHQRSYLDRRVRRTHAFAPGDHPAETGPGASSIFWGSGPGKKKKKNWTKRIRRGAGSDERERARDIPPKEGRRNKETENRARRPCQAGPQTGKKSCSFSMY